MIGTFTSQYEYVFIPTSHYRKGVEKIVAEISLTSRPRDCSIWIWDIEKHELNILKDLDSPRKRGGRYEIIWEMIKPDPNIICIIRFVRTEM